MLLSILLTVKLISFDIAPHFRRKPLMHVDSLEKIFPDLSGGNGLYHEGKEEHAWFFRKGHCLALPQGSG
jgi:hypothetical protein